MPSKRTMRRGGSKYAYKKKTGRKAPTVKSVAKSVKKLQKNQELKHVDITCGGVINDLLGTIVLLNPLSQGTTDTTRIANDVHNTSIQFRGCITSDSVIADGSQSSCIVRVLVFWDRQANGATVSMSDVFDQSVVTEEWFAPYNMDYQKRFKILYDKTFTVNPNYGLATVQQGYKVPFRFKIPLGRETKYDGNAGTVADIETNALYMYYISDNAPPDCTLAGYTRLIYKD